MQYPGGKNLIFRKIINLMPRHRVYIEPFLGSGAVMRHKLPAQMNIGIDMFPEALRRYRDESIKSGVIPILGDVTRSFDDTPRAEDALNLLCGDSLAFLEAYNYQGDELIYCDPPYLMKTRKVQRPLYKFEFSTEQHVQLLQIAKQVPCKVILSGYASDLYKRELQGWNVITFEARTRGGGKALEHLWFNYEQPTELHDYRYLGQTFKKRECIRLKAKRWRKKFEGLPILERRAILKELLQVEETHQKQVALDPIHSSTDASGANEIFPAVSTEVRMLANAGTHSQN